MTENNTATLDNPRDIGIENEPNKSNIFMENVTSLLREEEVLSHTTYSTGWTMGRDRYEFHDGTSVILERGDYDRKNVGHGVHADNLNYLRSILPGYRYKMLPFLFSHEVEEVIRQEKVFVPGPNDWANPVNVINLSS